MKTQVIYIVTKYYFDTDDLEFYTKIIAAYLDREPAEQRALEEEVNNNNPPEQGNYFVTEIDLYVPDFTS